MSNVQRVSVDFRKDKTGREVQRSTFACMAKKAGNEWYPSAPGLLFVRAKHDSGKGSFMEYDFYASKAGEVTIYTYMLSLFAEGKTHSTSYGIQIDDLEYKTQSNDVIEYSEEWAGNVIRNSAVNQTKFIIDQAGKHTLKIYVIDPGMIIQKIVIELDGLKDSYIGPGISRVE